MRTPAVVILSVLVAVMMVAVFPAAAAGATTIDIVDDMKNYLPATPLNGTVLLRFDVALPDTSLLAASIDGSSAINFPLSSSLATATYQYKNYSFSYIITANGKSEWYAYPEKTFTYRLQASGTCGNQECAGTGTCECNGLCTPPSYAPYSCPWSIQYDDTTGAVRADEGLKFITDASMLVYPPTSANDDIKWSQLRDTAYQDGVETIMRMACGNSDYMGQPTYPNGWVKRSLPTGDFVGIPGGTKAKITIEPFDGLSLTTSRQKFVQEGCAQLYACGGIYNNNALMTSGFTANGTAGEITLDRLNASATYMIVYLPPAGPSLCAYVTNRVMNSTTWTASSVTQSGIVGYGTPYSKQYNKVQMPSVFNDSNRAFINPPSCPGYAPECSQTATSYSLSLTNDTTGGKISIGLNTLTNTVGATTTANEITGTRLIMVSLSSFRNLRAPSSTGSHALSISLQGGPQPASQQITFNVCTDADADGRCSVQTGGNDCNDTAAGIYPGAKELCNAMDDDCDGLVDEDFMAAGRKLGTGCGTGICNGTWVCSWDKKDVTCNVLTAPATSEVCGNGLDDDCDGVVDESYEVDTTGNPVKVCGTDCTDGTTQECRALGECANPPGTRTCIKGRWGVCKGVTQPVEEMCNGKDEDCDGIIDDVGGATDPIETQCGCTNQPADKIPGIMSKQETCGNTIDDNCNGHIDEGCTCTSGQIRPCGISRGICEKGSQACRDGQWEEECRGEVRANPEGELCFNNMDDDCDGVVDEGCTAAITCQNGVKDPNEDDVDCGGVCAQRCSLPYNWILVAGGVILFMAALIMLVLKKKV